MLAGLLASLAIPSLVRMGFPGATDIQIFPLILVISFLASWIATCLTKPDDMETLKVFYKQTRPWGFWEPVKKEVLKEDPGFVPNSGFKRDAFNVLIGIIWQMSMVVIPLYLLSKNSTRAIIAVMVLVITSVILKKTWYDNLKNID
jgi:hypothetical protein